MTRNPLVYFVTQEDIHKTSGHILRVYINIIFQSFLTTFLYNLNHFKTISSAILIFLTTLLFFCPRGLWMLPTPCCSISLCTHAQKSYCTPISMEAENCLSPKIATWRREFLATDKEMHQRVAILQQGAENADFFSLFKASQRNSLFASIIS